MPCFHWISYPVFIVCQFVSGFIGLSSFIQEQRIHHSPLLFLFIVFGKILLFGSEMYVHAMNQRLLLAVFFRSAYAFQCYWQNGSDVQGSNYLACNLTVAASACCAVYGACTTDRWRLGSAGFAYRGGCTDSTWKWSACQQQYCNSPGTYTLPGVHCLA